MKMKNSNDSALTWLDKQAVNFEKSRFGAMSAMMIIQSCLASIAAGLVLSLETVVPLVITTLTAMGSNAIFIAQGPAKWCIIGFIVSIIANLIIILGALIW